jgi:hypothetical protein
MNLFSDIRTHDLRLGIDAAKALADDIIRENPVLATVILAGAELGSDEIFRRIAAGTDRERF